MQIKSLNTINIIVFLPLLAGARGQCGGFSAGLFAPNPRRRMECASQEVRRQPGRPRKGAHKAVGPGVNIALSTHLNI